MDLKYHTKPSDKTGLVIARNVMTVGNLASHGYTEYQYLVSLISLKRIPFMQRLATLSYITTTSVLSRESMMSLIEECVYTNTIMGVEYEERVKYS